MNVSLDRIPVISETRAGWTFGHPSADPCPISCRPECPTGKLDESILVRFDFTQEAGDHSDPRVIRLPVPVLGGSQVSEVWRSRLAVHAGHDGPIGHGENGEVLFARLRLADESDALFSDVVHDAYRRLFSHAAHRGYPHVLRMWNLVPNLNRGDGDHERYKHFCAGRARAFDEMFAPGMRPPAASCVGNDRREIVIYMLAACQPGVPIENPRQVRPELYPRPYGLRRPAFSRAMLQRLGEGALLHVSGTASIVGHESRHIDDPDRQLEETVRNLRAVVESAATLGNVHSPRFEQVSSMRVYLRDERLLERVRSGLRQIFGPNLPATFLRADICRSSLLLEIDGLWCTAHS